MCVWTTQESFAPRVSRRSQLTGLWVFAQKFPEMEQTEGKSELFLNEWLSLDLGLSLNALSFNCKAAIKVYTYLRLFILAQHLIASFPLTFFCLRFPSTFLYDGL